MNINDENEFRKAVKRSRKVRKLDVFSKYPSWLLEDVRHHAERLRNAGTVMDIEQRLSFKFGLPKAEIKRILEA